MDSSNNISLEDFINLPETVSLAVRRSTFFDRYIEERPYIRAGTTLLGEYIIVYIRGDKINSVIRDFGTAIINAFAIVLGLMDRTNLEEAGILRVHNQPFLDLRGSGVLVGFVDTGVDYTSESFRYEDGSSKIKYIWDQSQNMSLSANPPLGFHFGAEYTQQQINEALHSNNPSELVPHEDTSGHGTFLASVAAGRDNNGYLGAAPDSELIVVKLRKASQFYIDKYLVPPEQENVYESHNVMLGIEYIFRKAQVLNRPVAICIGIGTNLGAHDGFSLLEEYISGISHRSGTCICTAAGNESQARHQTQGVIQETGESEDIDIRVSEQGGNILMTLWTVASDRVSVSLQSPTGERIGRIPAKSGATFRTRLVLERAVVQVEYFFPVDGSGGQLTVITITDATPGIWSVNVHGDIILNGRYNAWLPVTGFITPGIEFLRPSPNYTIVVPATTIGTITCGAYNSITGSLYPASSWGPTRLPMMSPDLVAPGVDVGGVYPQYYGTMSGTSVSTAITTGACALMLQWGIVERNNIVLNTFRIKSYLIRGCVRESNISYPNVRWGYGKLNLLRTFDLMRQT